jgi:hypothetical protein
MLEGSLMLVQEIMSATIKFLVILLTKVLLILSSVIIAGDLFTSSTILHNNGDIVAGGNVAIITGGNGFVYPVNPGAIVSVTGTPTQPAELPIDPVLIALMNEVIYGGTVYD